MATPCGTGRGVEKAPDPRAEDCKAFTAVKATAPDIGRRALQRDKGTTMRWVRGATWRVEYVPNRSSNFHSEAANKNLLVRNQRPAAPGDPEVELWLMEPSTQYSMQEPR